MADSFASQHARSKCVSLLVLTLAFFFFAGSVQVAAVIGTVDQSWAPSGSPPGGNAIKYHAPIGQSFKPTMNNLVGVDINILNAASLDAAEATYVGGNAIDFHSPIGQSFTPTYAIFTGLDVYLMNSAPATRTVTMNLRSGAIGGPVVGSKAFTVAASAAWAWIHIDMSSPVSITPGSLYVIELVEPVGGTSWGCNTPGTYAGGTAIYNGAVNAAFDNMFKTFGVTDRLTLNIRSGSIGGPVVSTAPRSVSVIPSFTWESISFTQFSITPGATYVIEVIDPQGSASWGESIPGGYPDGQAIISGTPTSGDNWFRTYGVPATPDFSISSSTMSISVMQGSSGDSSITITSLNGFSAAVALSPSWVGSAPSGVTFSLPGPVTPPSGSTASSPLTVTASSAASTGSYTLRVSATSGSLTRQVDIGVQITAAATTTGPTTATATVTTTATPTTSTGGPTATVTTTASPTTTTGGPGCLIATATYGSELAPEVQLLRNFRDNSIMKSQSGSNFMIVFNAFYYSFSPAIANYLSTHSIERTIVKGALYPLIGILELSSLTYSAAGAYPEFAVLLSGLLASSLIGAFYLGLPIGLIRARVRRLRQFGPEKFIEKILGGSLTIGILAVLLGQILASPMVLMVSSSTIVVSTLTLSSIATSSFLSKRIASSN